MEYKDHKTTEDRMGKKVEFDFSEFLAIIALSWVVTILVIIMVIL